jgi:hypothetical protein
LCQFGFTQAGLTFLEKQPPSQVAFAKWSVCDRFTFATQVFETGLPKYVREKTGSVFERGRSCCGFLWCGFCEIVAKLPQFIDVSAEIRRNSLLLRLDGGEGGIRTPDTGVSPYNGLAIVCINTQSCNRNNLQSHWRTEDDAM